MEEVTHCVSSMPVREFNIDVPWGHIAVKAHGDPGASPVLCLHGKQDNAGSFQTLIPLLPESFYYVAIDLPSHGLSSHMPPGNILHLVDFTFAVDRVVQHFEWKSFQIVGHSLGSIIGFIYASFYPLRVTKLVAIDPICELRFSNEELFNFIIDRHEKLLALEKELASKSPPSYTEEEAVRRIVENRRRRSFLPKDTAKFLFNRGVKLNQEGYSFVADQRNKLTVPILYSKQQLLELYSRIQCPMLVLRASFSLSDNHNFDDFDFMFRNTLGKTYQHKVVEGGHDLHLAEPEKIANDVAKYLLLSKSSL